MSSMWLKAEHKSNCSLALAKKNQESLLCCNNVLKPPLVFFPSLGRMMLVRSISSNLLWQPSLLKQEKSTATDESYLQSRQRRCHPPLARHRNLRTAQILMQLQGSHQQQARLV